MSKPIQVSVFIIFNYLVLKFLYGTNLDKMVAYGSYVFEIFFVGFVLLVYKHKFQKPKIPQKRNIIFYVASLVLGFGIYTFAIAQNITIPFDFSMIETVVFLLIISPILEELIFRQALWFAFQDALKNKWSVLIVTSILFSYAHFHAYWTYSDVPELKTFIIYQTAYTLILGFWWGLSFMREKNIAHPILLHFFFNLGFYLGSFF